MPNNLMEYVGNQIGGNPKPRKGCSIVTRPPRRCEDPYSSQIIRPAFLDAVYVNWGSSCLAADWGTNRLTPLSGSVWRRTVEGVDYGHFKRRSLSRFSPGLCQSSTRFGQSQLPRSPRVPEGY